jgi:alpha-D-xyloside xylohydrolase
VYSLRSRGIEIPFGLGKLIVEFYDSNIVHVSHIPQGVELKESFVVVAKPRDALFTVEEKDNVINISSDEISVSVDVRNGVIVFRFGSVEVKEIARGSYDVNAYGVRYSAFEQMFEIEQDSSLYGLGQHAGFSAHGVFNYRNHTVYLVQRNTDIAVPFLVSSAGYGILWDMYSMGVVESREKTLRVWFEAGDYLSYYIIYGPEIDRVIAGYRWLTGKAVMLPKYAFGYWQSKERYASQEEIVSVARMFREKGIPIDIIVQDWRYWGDYGWNAFRFDEKIYPDPKKMVEDIHRLGLKIAISIWPIFEKKTDIYREAKEIGCIMAGGAEDYGVINVFKSGCREWFWKKISEVFFSIGIDGWWLDASEPEVGPGLIYATWQKGLDIDNGEKMIKYLNLYPLQETKAVYEGQRRESDKRVLILTRSGFAGIQRHGVVNWSGDITADWTTLRTQLWAGLNYSISGLPYWTTDIGGFFSGNPDTEGYRELFIRWFQWGAFCPIFRVHGTYYPKEPWRFGKEVEEILVKYIRLRYRLLPYIYTLAWMVYEKDYTIMRPLVMDFRDDRNVYNIDDQYMFGPFIMVSPITTPSTFEREVYLPRGLWHDFWTGDVLSGGRKLKVRASLDTIPLHVRAGAIIPLVPATMKSGMEAVSEIELRVYRGRDSEFAIYIDDGESYDYEKGIYSLIPIKWIDSEKKLIFGDKIGSMDIGNLKIKIVFVEKGKGIGLEEAKPDIEILYEGKRKEFTV